MVWILANAVTLLPVGYGLKCIATLSGRCVAPKGPERTYRGEFALVPVENEAAILAGLGYVALGVFVYLSSSADDSSMDTVWALVWRLVRGAIRWGSLVAMLWLWHKAGRV